MTYFCRYCSNSLDRRFVDLGMTPLSNSYVRAEELGKVEPFYPLTAFVCNQCLLVQLPAVETPQRIFSEYAYFSSFSDSWLGHAREYSKRMWSRLSLSPRSTVVEIASNDGYLLQYFKELGVQVLGIEPAVNVAEAAREKGIDTLTEFFGAKTAERLVSEGIRADLLVGNNVLAHVPDLNDFVSGMKLLLARDGTATIEFPHLLQLMQQNQFDTIYHEHYSYFSLGTVRRIFASHGLEVFDVEEIPTHGGSLRVFARHAAEMGAPEQSVADVEKKECMFGIDRLEAYDRFEEQVRATKRKLLAFLIGAKEEGKSVVGYGAPAKGNTLLNYCGIGTDFIDFTVDRSPHKQGLFLPGTHIPILSPDKIAAAKPDYVLILPWNLREEIIDQMQQVRDWGGRFVVPIPRVEVIE